MVPQNQARYGCKITTVDPSTGYIGVVMKGDAQERQVLHVTHTTASRWPVVGENWIVHQHNGTWYLDGLWATSSTYNNTNPGDAIIDAPTGTMHVINSVNRVNDFSFTRSIAIPTYGSIITIDALAGSWQTITVTDNHAFTIKAPINTPTNGTTTLTIEVYNNSGGSMGTITWNSIFKFAGRIWTNPTNSNRRFARFDWNGSAWVCITIASADY